ncbi:MAG: glutamate--tRNA ligase family protein, partial [candidate division Zixibacteria bacterium]|nr:glutamate--tRNA ligase family protein [candidate division Zixibacteria bacterium]
ALNLPTPEFGHLPLILGADKKKVSKREGAAAVTDYRDLGYFPETMLNFLTLLGWSPGDGREIMTKEELIAAFTMERVNAANPVFDEQKLEWMNGEYVRKFPDEELLERVSPFLEKAGLVKPDMKTALRGYLLKVVSLLKERCRLLTDFPALGDYFFREEFDYDPKGAEKQFGDPQAPLRLAKVIDAWRELEPFTKGTAEDALRVLSEKEGEKAAAFIHPIRLALTGKTMGPALFDIVETLGKERVLARLSRAAAFIKTKVVSPA